MSRTNLALLVFLFLLSPPIAMSVSVIFLLVYLLMQDPSHNEDKQVHLICFASMLLTVIAVWSVLS